MVPYGHANHNSRVTIVGSRPLSGTRMVYLTSFVAESRMRVTAATIRGLSGVLP